MLRKYFENFLFHNPELNIAFNFTDILYANLYVYFNINIMEL